MAREVKVAVVGDARQLQKELQKAEKAVAGFGKNAKESGNLLKDVFIGGTIALGAKQIIDSASQLQAAVGGTAAVFGSASEQVSKFAQSAAETSGLSEKAARDLTSKLGASLKGAGLSAEEAAKQAILLTQTGADLAATLGGTTEEAVSALGGALRGEFDPLERFGIALKASDINARAVAMGLAKSESDVSAYAKGQAALALITERSAFAQGTFAKEAGTAEGAAKIAGARLQNTSADIGKSFLPIYTKAAEIVGALAQAFAALPGPVQTGVIAIAGIAAVGPKIYNGIGSAVTAIKSIPTSLEKAALKFVDTNSAMAGFGQTAEKAAGQATSAAGAGGIGALTPALAGVGIALAAGAFLWKNYQDQQEAARRRAQEFMTTLDSETGAFTEQTSALLRNKLETRNQIDNLSKAGIAFKDFEAAIKDTNSTINQDISLNAIAAANFGVSAEIRKRDAAAIREQGGAKAKLIARLVEEGQLDEGLLTTIQEGTDAYKANLEVIRQRTIQAEMAAGADRDQAEAAGEAAVKNAENAKAIKETYDNTLALLNSNIAYQQAQVSAQKAIEEYNASLRNGSLTAQERKDKELGLLSQFLSTAGAAAKAAEDQAKLEGKTLSAGDAAKIQRDKLVELANQVADGSPVRYGLQMMINQLQGVIDRQNINVKIRLDAYEAIVAIDDVNERVRQMKRFAYSPGSYDYSQVPQRAVGGPVAAGSPYLVGERGPELFIPAGYGRIVDNMATMSMLTGGTAVGGSGTVNVTINMAPGANGDDVIDAIRRYERRNGPIFASV